MGIVDGKQIDCVRLPVIGRRLGKDAAVNKTSKDNKSAIKLCFLIYL